MWCIPKVDKLFIERMEEILDLYAKPYNPQEPVLCFDEKSKELHADLREPEQTTATHTRRRDYEYVRNGTANLFVTVEPKGGFRRVHVTKRRTKRDFAKEIRQLLSLRRYKDATIIHIVLDNLNTHFESSFREMYGDDVTAQLMKRIHFHYTPTHASWLNMAEIEISVLSRQALNTRIPTETVLRQTVRSYSHRRNREHAQIHWKFTTTDAHNMFKYNEGS